MRTLLILTTLFAWLAPPTASAAERPVCPVYRLATAPTIDGNVRDDPAWKTVPGLTGFHVLGGGYTFAKQSTVRVGWTTNALYISMDCEEPDIKRIADARKDGDRLWLDNGVELFLQRPGAAAIFQFIVNTSGARTMGAGRDKVSINDWTAATMKGEDFWSVEVEIPFTCFGSTPAAGAEWRGAFCRNIWEYSSGGDRFTTWPPLSAQFREPESFAVLAFQGRSLSPQQAARVALKLNLPYREHLTQQIKDLARAGREYEAPIAKAAAAPGMRAEAQDLAQAWKRIAALAAEPARAPIPEVRTFVAKATDLKQRSYELKYRFLMEQLLAE